MFYGLNNFIKKLLPKQLFYRALLIVAAPIIILQITISIVFFDSLWIKTNKGMTRALVGEIKFFINAYENEEYEKDCLMHAKDPSPPDVGTIPQSRFGGDTHSGSSASRPPHEVDRLHETSEGRANARLKKK